MEMNQYSRVYAEISLDAILHNMEAMHRNLPAETKIMAVIKADGYGHGAVEIAEAVDPLDYLYGYGVATVEEGLALRSRGIRKPVLILGYVFPDQYEEMIRADIRPTVFTRGMTEELSKAAVRAGADCRIHFAVDTGMSRIGYRVTEEAAEEMARMAELPHIMVEGIFTHFARADEADKSHTEKQLAEFGEMISMLEKRGVHIPLKHCLNSAGIVDLPEKGMDLVRAGIITYGLWPSDEVRRDRLPLQAALSLFTHVAYVKEVPAGRAISYGGTYVTKEPRKIATIPVGYGDGYPRSLSNQGYVLIHGKRAPIIGRVCMDQFMVDVTEIEAVRFGDKAVLVGEDGGERITVEELSDLSDRFNYEFICSFGKRVPREYLISGKVVEQMDYFA